MSIKLNTDKTELTLSGEPAGMSGFGDYDVRLEDAVVIPVSLTVNLPSDGSVKVKSGEESRLNQSIEPGEYIDGITLVPKDANYKMTQAWRQTITVEPANEHIMMMTSDTETYISGRISENTVITAPALEITQTHDSYDWTIGGIGTELYYERGYNSTNTHELIETSHSATYGGISPTMFFGHEILDLYVYYNDSPRSAKLSGPQGMKLVLDTTNGTAGLSGTIIANYTIGSNNYSIPLSPRPQTDSSRMEFVADKASHGLESNTIGTTIPVKFTYTSRRGGYNGTPFGKY